MIPGSHSLKEKRMVLRKIKDRVRNKFNCGIAEVGDLDEWQSAQLAFTVVSNQHGFSQAMVQRILDFIESLGVAKITDDEQDFVPYGDENIDSTAFAHWEPDQEDPDLVTDLESEDAG